MPLESEQDKKIEGGNTGVADELERRYQMQKKLQKRVEKLEQQRGTPYVFDFAENGAWAQFMISAQRVKPPDET